MNNVALGLYTSNYIVRHFTRGTRPDVQIPTIMRKAGYPVELIGKVADVITCEGARKSPHVPTPLVLNEVYDALGQVKRGLIAVNIQETDLAGHDESAQRYADCLRLSDDGIGKIMRMLGPKDVLMVTGDHGNDPTIGHDKHTREFTPCLVWGQSVQPIGLYMRDSLADFAATIAEIFAVDRPEIGKSFWSAISVN